MAKLKAPLFSLGASGAIGKALVYFGWKGLNVVREYVVPANPRSAAQLTQRGYLADAIEAIHSAQAEAADPLDATDIIAYALRGSCHATPRTWFNEIVKIILDQLVAGLEWCIGRNGSLVAGDTQLTFTIAAFTTSVGGITNGMIYYGTSKTALVNTQAATAMQMNAGVIIAGLTNGIKYFAEWRPTVPVTYLGTRGGIYHGKPTA